MCIRDSHNPLTHWCLQAHNHIAPTRTVSQRTKQHFKSPGTPAKVKARSASSTAVAPPRREDGGSWFCGRFEAHPDGDKFSVTETGPPISEGFVPASVQYLKAHADKADVRLVNLDYGQGVNSSHEKTARVSFRTLRAVKTLSLIHI